MKINSTITKVMAATVAAGAVTLSAVGFGGTASADQGNATWVPANSPQAIPQAPVYNPYRTVRYNTPVLINGRWVYSYQGYVAPNYVAPNYFAPNYAVPNYAVPNYVAPAYVYQLQYVQAAVTASQFSFITSSASVLGMNREQVVVRLQQGRTLTSIAAERGIDRVTFYNAVVNTMRGSINVAVSSGSIDPVMGNALQQNLNNRAGIVIDQPGTTSGVNAAAIETAYQLF